MDTILAADAAFPFDYSRLPKGVEVILGYTGQPQCTPHVWTEAEVDHARASGRVWAPIHTPPQSPFTLEAGKQAGNLMVAELARYRLPAHCPVFLDIEHASYVANRDHARQGVAAWQAILHKAGHPNAWAYLPAEAESGWVADWVGTAPEHFAPGVIGVQYAGNVDGGRYDLSVFSRDVFASLFPQPKDSPVSLTAADKAWITDQLAVLRTDFRHVAQYYGGDSWEGHPNPNAVVHVHHDTQAILKQLATAPAGPVDTEALAASLAKVLGPSLGASVVAALGKALVG